MKSPTKFRFQSVQMLKQRGVVLFFALIAMLAMSLAAVALIRSVDTSTMIAGNLAFKQAATSSGDTGVENAISWLAVLDAANSNLNVLSDITHPFNIDAPLNGYYSNMNPAVSLTDGTGIQWDNNDSALVGTDASGNTVHYVIQRMCRTANVAIQNASCLFSSGIVNNNGQQVLLPQEICDGAGCPPAGQTPQIRITTKTDGPRNTVSYVQTFVY